MWEIQKLLFKYVFLICEGILMAVNLFKVAFSPMTIIFKSEQAKSITDDTIYWSGCGADMG